jgi:hypothetical protein
MGRQMTTAAATAKPFPCPRHAELEERIEALENRPDPEKLLPELVALRRASEQACEAAKTAKDIAATVFNEVAAMRSEVRALAEWRDDSKVHEIAELKRALEEKTRADLLTEALKAERASLHEIRTEERRDLRDERGDRRKFRYQLAAAVVVVIVTGVVGVATGRASSHAQCSHQAVGGR